MPIFHGLGRSLRWLRDRQGKRQYQVADSAGITKAMLSAYETGKQKPSLDTLEKILEALGSDLAELHNALQIVNERPPTGRRPEPQSPSGWASAWRGGPTPGGDAGPKVDVYRMLGFDRPLPEEEEQALGEMLAGFIRLLRFLHRAGSFAEVADDERVDVFSD
ncbi:MAG TPA: helix-turn-helix transcriptional regulator [Thermoanaerobaculia bacterium]|nr:helix-turn-helix transcriptional regulator [Thermoanaerobaculia bacterium]